MFSRRSQKEQRLSGTLHLPLNAMTISRPRASGEGVPSAVTLSAVLELDFPKDWKRRTIRGVRLVLRGVSILDMGRGEVETDLFFEHCQMDPIKDSLHTPPDELKILDEKMERIGFGIDFPIEVPASDIILPGAHIKYFMIFQIIGRDADPTLREPHLSTVDLEKHNHHLPFPPFPDIPPLEHSLTFIAPLNVVHDPGPTAHSRVDRSLDMVSRSNLPDLGVVELRLTSDIFTVAGPCQLQMTLNPPPRATVYALVVSVRQDQLLTSPRDSTQVKSSKTVPFLTAGVRPICSKPEIADYALWRGEQAGGTDTGSWNGLVSGRFPHASETRASTLPGITSPVTLKHSMVFELYYSLSEQDPIDPIAFKQGELLRFRASRTVVFPNCMLIVASSDLPKYPAERSTRPDLDKYYLDTPCPSCSRPPIQNLCHECTYKVVPHVRHDLSWLEGCTKCARSRLTPKGEVNHVSVGVCACIDWMEWYVSTGTSQLRVRTVDGGVQRQVERDGVIALKYAQEKGRAENGDDSSLLESISKVQL